MNKMTLSRQLMLSGLIILLCLFTGMITFVVKNTQEFMDQQLASHSQDTATALGLTLTTIMKNDDVVTASRAVDAVWDRGFYKSIIIETSNGSPLVERHQEVKMHGVPEWFIQFLHLNTELKEALIMDGWSIVGKVKIESNPGFAYQQIWLTFVDSLQWFLMTAFLAVILGGVLLYIILRPLRAITAQALAICNQQFSIQETLPWTLDLRLVVEAMNNMSKRLKQLFEEQVRVSEVLREQAYKDPVTKLGNRQYFDMQFEYLLNDKEKGISGALLLIELNNFKEYNDKHGYQEGDKLLINVAKALQGRVVFDNAIISHAKGASFFVILPNKSKEVAVDVAASLCNTFNELQRLGLSKEADIASIGVVTFNQESSKKDILTQADMALRQAQTQGMNQWHFDEVTKQEHMHGSQEWATIFATVLRENKVLLYFQETSMFENKTQKIYETLMRIKLSETDIISAGVFMPMAESLNQIIPLDRLVIENVIQRILMTKNENHYSVNLSPSSLEDEEFKRWLLTETKLLGKKAKHLIIELPEYGVISRIERVREFFLKFSALGGQTSIDHYGKNFSSFSYLYNLKLNYLKIDGGFIKNIHEKEENQFFIRSLIDIAHSLGIAVIAESVETEQEFTVLEELRVDGVQGYFVGKPTELDV